MIRNSLLARTALGLALTFGAGAIAAPAVAAPKTPAAPKVALSKGFAAVAAPAQKAIEAAKTRPDVLAAQARVDAARGALSAAQGAPAKAAAKTANDSAVAALGATLSAERAQLDGVYAAAVSPDDKYVAGQFGVSLGGLARDPAIQVRGLRTMIDSGKTPAADLGKFNYYIGSLAYDARDFATARTALQAAVAAGYHDNDTDALLADAYLIDNQVPQGLTLLQKAIDDARARGQVPAQNWYARGLSAAYKAKLLPQAATFSQALVSSYPTSQNWAGAIAVVREVANFPPQETLDLMRLMLATNSFTETRDFVDYIQASDPRRSPGEVLKIVNLGMAQGKLKGVDVFVNEAKTTAQARIAADRASLPAMERDARAGAAGAAIVTAAADAYLSYDDYAKAADLFKLALTKPGIDSARTLTRLGIAQTMLGQYADAQASFGKVTGARQPIARLWSIYAAQKANPVGAAPVSPAATPRS